MTDNAVQTPAPADHSAADAAAKALIKDLQAIIKDLTGWQVWASDAGVLYATRHQSLTAVELDAGLERTVADEDPRELVKKIQQELRKSSKLAVAAAAPPHGL